MNNAVVRAVAHYVPPNVVTNQDLSKFMDTTDEWIRERTGIRERRYVEPGTSTADLGELAARTCLDRAEWTAADVDLLVVATLSPDYYFPGVGTLLQKKLGCRTIPALDIRVQCSGFVYGMDLIDSHIKAKKAKKVLFICSEVQSPVLDLTTRGREMAVLFGDGAGALAIEAVEETYTNRGVLDSLLGSDGSGADVLCLKTPGTATPGFIRKEDIENAKVHPYMEGKIVFKHAVSRLIETATTLLTRNNLCAQDISLLVPHQANLRINEMVREQLGLSSENVFNNIQRYGNTTAATIPICLSEAVEEGRLKQGDLVMTIAFGAGFTWGANLIRW